MTEPAVTTPPPRRVAPPWMLLVAAVGVLLLLPIGSLLGMTTDLFAFTTVSTRVRDTKATMVLLRNALSQYQMTYNAYPRSLVQLQATGMLAPQGNSTVDGWNLSFTYSPNSKDPNRPYSLRSAGPNRVLGDGDDIDVWNLPP